MKTKIFERIEDIPSQLWNGLTEGHSCAFSHEFWQLIEQSGLNDFKYRHIIFFDDQENPIAVSSFYSVTTDIAIFAPLGLRTVLTKIRSIFPNFLKLRMLECGTPITVSSPPIVGRPHTSTPQLIPTLHQVLHRVAKKERQLLIIIRDFEPNASRLRTDFTRLGYHWVDSLPNTYLDIRWTSIEQYRASLKSYYRSKLLKHLKINKNNNIRHELHDNFHDLADTLSAQWLVVHEQADEFQREVLTPKFYRELSLRMGNRSKALLFFRGDELVGHALLLLDGNQLRWLYFGRNQAVNDSLYLYVAHTVIETAILLGAKQLEMGLTTYAIKQDLGAQVTPIHLALRSSLPIINAFVGKIYPLLNCPPRLKNKNVFKTDC